MEKEFYKQAEYHLKEFNLSEHISSHKDSLYDWIDTEDVKEFIKLLKSHITFIPLLRKIDKLAGEELI